MTDFLLTYRKPHYRDPETNDRLGGDKIKSKRVTAHTKIEAIRLGAVLVAALGAGSMECREIPRVVGR